MSDNKVLTWIVDSVLNASKVEDLFKQKLLNIACLLVQVSSKAANNRYYYFLENRPFLCATARSCLYSCKYVSVPQEGVGSPVGTIRALAQDEKLEVPTQLH